MTSDQTKELIDSAVKTINERVTPVLDGENYKLFSFDGVDNNINAVFIGFLFVKDHIKNAGELQEFNKRIICSLKHWDMELEELKSKDTKETGDNE